MNALSRFRKTLEQWGLRDIPFRSTPPEDVNQLARIFHGRKEELAVTLPTLYEGRNVLVRGIWGVGKTAFIRYLLYRLQKESVSLGEEMLILYIGRFPGEEPEALYHAILIPLAEILAKDEPKARQVYEVLSGLQITRSHQAHMEGKVNLQLFSLGGSWDYRQEKRWRIQDVYRALLDLLNVAQERYGRVILAVDDLDKKTPRAVLDIIDAATDLLRRGERKRSFLLTGRYTSTLRDISDQMLGLFSETITLPHMTTEDLYHIAVNYLNTVRQQPCGDVTPFTPEIITQIAEYAYHIPRQFNLICERVMRRAAMEGIVRIDENTFPRLWSTIQESFALDLTPEIRRLLYMARRRGGLDADIDDATLKELGVETFIELVPLLKSLEGDVLIKMEDGKWVPSNLFPTG